MFGSEEDSDACFSLLRMSFADFVNNFDELQLCHLQPDALIAELTDNDVSLHTNCLFCTYIHS